MSGQIREIDVTERTEVPWLSVVLGYGPMLPFVVGAVAAWSLDDASRGEAVLITSLWGGSILAFLAGVRRGLSFRTESGPTWAQIATMFCLFVLALASLAACAHGWRNVGVLSAFVGFIALAVLDPIAARRGEAPLFFARLRPPQFTIAIVSLAAVLLASVMGRP